MTARVEAVSAAPAHGFSKPIRDSIRLLPGLGVEGDAHCGQTVKHRSRVARDPTQPNLRQVHLVHSELIAELQAAGFEVHPGAMGENVTTADIDLLSLPVRTRLRLGAGAILEVTGLRNPCSQLDRFQAGLMKAVLSRGPGGELIRRAGIMAVVTAGGIVRPSDLIEVLLPEVPHMPLTVV